LINLQPDYFSRRVLIIDGSDKSVLPDWAASLVWLGAWCRLNRLEGRRLISFAVLPSRALAAAFASLGCLVAGASVFEDTLSWLTFRILPSGREVFWRQRDGGVRYRGNIVGFKNQCGTEFIVVEVSKAPRRAEVGSRREISRSYFDDYRFTEEEPPALTRAVAFDKALESLAALVENLNPKWIWADGSEGLLVTSVASFETAIADLSLSIGGQSPICISDLLCLGRNKGQRHGKLRIEHPRGALDGNFALAILDGATAFMAHEHLATAANMLVILDRPEFQAGMHDEVLRLKNISLDSPNTHLLSTMPRQFPPGLELAAFSIDVK
jgi:hypothetical protein